jgi:hypothetical protein
MERVALTLAGLVVLGLALVASPALSVRPYVAAPVDFELAGPPAVASGGGPVTSPVLKAPGRFDLVGMRWSSRARPDIELRARKAGGRWTTWTHVPADPDDAPDRGSRERSPRGFSAPVWTGEAEFVQYRLSRPVAGLRLHFVNALGTATRVDRIRTAVRRAAHSAALAVARVVAPAAAAEAQPAIQPRAAWGADACPPRSAASYGEVKAALVHHTVSANEYTQEEVPALILSICRYHRNSNGWNDIGYNFLVDKYGGLWEGRAGGIDQPVIGAQAQGYNSQTTGIADIGNHQDLPEGIPALDAIARLIRWKLPLHGAPTSGPVTLVSGGGSLNRYSAGTQVTMDRVSGHRDGDSTECPGNALYAQLPDLRRRVGSVAPDQSRTKFADTAISPSKLVYPAQATVSGRLLQITGEAIPGMPVQVQAYGSSGWRAAWQATTGDDGGFSVKVGARLSHTLRVQYAGDPGRAASTSPPMNLVIVPELSLSRSAARRPVGQGVTLSGTVQPAKTRLVLVVERRLGNKRARGTIRIGARRGSFAKTYRFRSAGLYRFYVAFVGDKQNASATSAAVYVRAVPATRSRSTPEGGSGKPESAPQTGSGGGVSPGGGAAAR